MAAALQDTLERLNRVAERPDAEINGYGTIIEITHSFQTNGMGRKGKREVFNIRELIALARRTQ